MAALDGGVGAAHWDCGLGSGQIPPQGGGAGGGSARWFCWLLLLLAAAGSRALFKAFAREASMVSEFVRECQAALRCELRPKADERRVGELRPPKEGLAVAAPAAACASAGVGGHCHHHHHGGNGGKLCRQWSYHPPSVSSSERPDCALPVLLQLWLLPCLLRRAQGGAALPVCCPQALQSDACSRHEACCISHNAATNAPRCLPAADVDVVITGVMAPDAQQGFYDRHERAEVARVLDRWVGPHQSTPAVPATWPYALRHRCRLCASVGVRCVARPPAATAPACH